MTGKVTIVGPFWRQRPNAATTFVTWARCNLWIDDRGNVVVIEWL
jgi:hypothetical protein